MDPMRISTPRPLAGSAPPPLPALRAPAAEAAPSLPGDAAILQQTDDGTRSYAHLRTAEGADAQVWQARNGASYHLVAAAEGTRFEANIPAGLTQEPIQIVGSQTAGGAQAVAHPLGRPDALLPVEVTPDGKLAVTLAPHGPMALFDPGSLEYGVAAPSTPVASATGQVSMMTPLQEVVHADGSHTIKAQATVTDKPGGISVGRMLVAGPLGMLPEPAQREMRYLQIDDKGGQVSAVQVAETQPAAQGSTGVTGLLGGLLSGPARTESAVPVTRQADGSYQVTGGADLMDHLKSSLKNPFALQSPLASWLKGRSQAAQSIVPFSANPVALSSLGAAAGPALAAAVQVPRASSPAGIPVPPRLT